MQCGNEPKAALTMGEPFVRHGKTTTGAVEGEVVAKVRTTYARSWRGGTKTADSTGMQTFSPVVTMQDRSVVRSLDELDRRFDNNELVVVIIVVKNSIRISL